MNEFEANLKINAQQITATAVQNNGMTNGSLGNFTNSL